MKVFCTNGVRAVMREIAPEFERAAGVPLTAEFASTNMLLERIDRGESGDLAILTADAIERLIAQGKVVPGSRVDVARSAIGIAVRKGARLPDIGTVEALTRTLLAATSVAHSKTGISGLYAPALLRHLDIAEQVLPKTVVPDPVTVGEAVARGDAEMAFQQISELMEVPGIVVVGPLPAEVQKLTVFAAGLFAEAVDAESARMLQTTLRSDAVRPVYACMGLEAV